MLTRIEIELMPTEYRARWADSDFARSGPSVCITAMQDNKPLFVSIAEGEATFENDPDYERMKAAGTVRIFNPCDILAFEPENAAVVIYFFVNGAQRHLRARYPSLVREFFELFVDRFAVTIHLPGYESLPEEVQSRFRRALREVPGLKRFEILS